MEPTPAPPDLPQEDGDRSDRLDAAQMLAAIDKLSAKLAEEACITARSLIRRAAEREPALRHTEHADWLLRAGELLDLTRRIVSSADVPAGQLCALCPTRATHVSTINRARSCVEHLRAHYWPPDVLESWVPIGGPT